MTDRPAAIVTLGRDRGMGEKRRVESWQALLRAAGRQPTVIRLRAECRSDVLHPPSPAAVVAGHAAVETLAWSARSARRRLHLIRPEITVFVTLRAFHPSLLDVSGTSVLDYVDRLATSYHDRADLVPTTARRLYFQLLAGTMGRVERRRPPEVHPVAAGRSDADALEATWVPNVLEVPPLPLEERADHDVVFFGNLAYLPNVAAVERLASWWPEVVRRRPDARLLVTGRTPSARVREACRKMGATLEEGYDDPLTAARRGRVAVAPLQHVAGIQNKVLEAAAAGVPQVLSREALGGLPIGFPCEVADDGPTLAVTLDELLDDRCRRSELARRAHAEAQSTFTPVGVLSRLASVLQ